MGKEVRGGAHDGHLRVDSEFRMMRLDVSSREEVLMDWAACAAVESRPDKLSGAWVFVGTRVPLVALYQNLAAGATVEEFLDWFPGVEKWKVKAVLQHEAKALRVTDNR